MTRVRIRVRIRTSVTSCRVQVRVRYRRIILDRIKQLLCMLRLKPLDPKTRSVSVLFQPRGRQGKSITRSLSLITRNFELIATLAPAALQC